MDDCTRQKISATRNATHERRKRQKVFVRDLKIVGNKLNRSQRESLSAMFREAKWLRNDCLAHGIDDYKPSKTALVKTPTGIEERSITNLGTSVKQSIIAQLKHDRKVLAVRKARGYKIGALKFKSYMTTIPFKSHNVDWKLYENGRVKLQKVPGKIRVRGLRQIPKNAELANAKLTRRADGYHLLVTVCVDKADWTPTKIEKGTAVGIDFGIADQMTFSDGKALDIRFEETRRCKGLQRKLARQSRTNEAKGKRATSKNMRKTQAAIRKEHLKQTHRKDNAAKQLVSGLKSCEFVITQDDSFVSWKKRRTIKKKNGKSFRRGFGGRKIQSGILGRVKIRLNQMDNVTLLPRNEKTTQYCDVCETFTPHALDRRTYVCERCGYTDQRDVHAAQNMLILASKSPEVPMERRNALAELIAAGYETDFSALVAKRLTMKRETLKSLVSG